MRTAFAEVPSSFSRVFRQADRCGKAARTGVINDSPHGFVPAGSLANRQPSRTLP
jgi:hypothetical protein